MHRHTHTQSTYMCIYMCTYMCVFKLHFIYVKSCRRRCFICALNYNFMQTCRWYANRIDIFCAAMVAQILRKMMCHQPPVKSYALTVVRTPMIYETSLSSNTSMVCYLSSRIVIYNSWLAPRYTVTVVLTKYNCQVKRVIISTHAPCRTGG